MNVIAALLYSVASSVLIGIVLGFTHGALDARSALIALAGGCAVGLLGWWRSRKGPALPRLTPGSWIALGCFALFSMRAFLWLIFTDTGELRVLSPNNLGDMALHITFIKYIANGAPFWPDSPIFAAGKLTYAAGIDIFNSLLTLVGVDLVRGLIWTGLIGALVTGVALLRWGGAFTVMAFLFSGGLAGLAFFGGGTEDALFRDYQAEWAWKNLPLAILITQRGFLFALPAGLLLLMSWRSRFFGRSEWRLPGAGEFLLYASMPAFHLHTFLALSFLLATFFVVRRTARIQIALLVALAFVPAASLAWLSMGMLKSNAEPVWQDMSQLENPPKRPPLTGLGWQPGWMVNDSTTEDVWDSFAEHRPWAATFAAYGRFLIFWLGNFGILPLLLIPLVLVLLRQILPRPPSFTTAVVVAGCFLVITPLLGLWRGYQKESFGDLILGTSASPGLRAAVLALFAILALTGAIWLHRRNERDYGLRWVLLAFVGLYAIDGVLAALHTWNTRIPLLRANAVPLIIATAAFVLVLWHIAQRPIDDTWNASSTFPALFLFFVCCNVRFSSWDWDNTKLMIWSFVIVMPALWEVVIARWSLPARAVTCTLLFFSGCFSLLGGLNDTHHGYSIARLSTLDGVSQAVRRIPITETFAAQPTYNHPLLLSGRKVVLGYEGHLGSHGIRYEEVSRDLDALMLGFPDWRIRAARLGVRYLFYGPGEQETWPNSYESWRLGATVVASGEWGQLLDLQTPPAPVEERDPTTPR